MVIELPKEAAPVPMSGVGAGEASDAGGHVLVPPLSVLVAEDHPANRLLVRGMIQALGHQVDVVEDGQAAVERIASAPAKYDLVFLDMWMPRMDGVEAARQIRGLPAPACEVPLVAFTANAQECDRDACAAAGMIGFLPKPVKVAELRAEIERCYRLAVKVKERKPPHPCF